MAASPSHPRLESMPSFTTLENTATTTTGTILEVCVHLGRDLVSKDSNGLSDPYLKVFLLDKNGKAIKKSLQKSKIVKETLNPAFVDAHYEYSALPSGTSGVCVEVWDWDRWTADDFMGQLIFPIGSDSFDLETAWHKVKSRAKKRDRVSGDLLLQVRFDPAGLSPMVPKPTVKVADLLQQLIESLSRATDADEKNQLEATIDQLQKALVDHKKSGAKGDLRVAMDTSATGPDPLDSETFEDLDDDSIPESETADCPICYETIPQRAMRDYDCGHKYCKGCLSTDIITHINSGEVKSLKCPHPDCEATPNDYHVRAYAGREWYIKRTQFLALQSLRENPNARWCPDAACSAPIVVDPNTLPDSNEVTCVSCRKPFCFVCRHAGHQPSPCSDVKEGDDDLALKLYLSRQATKTKQCPRCHTGIEKNEGCNHMTCANCNHQWCWLCLGDCPDAPAHFNSPGPCNGHWFTQASTVEEAAQIESARIDYRQRHPIKTGLRRAGGIVATTVIVAGVVIIAVPVVILAVAAGVLFSVFT